MESTRDAILYGELMMEQPGDGPRVSVDTILLSAFVQIRERKRSWNWVRPMGHFAAPCQKIP